MTCYEACRKKLIARGKQGIGVFPPKNMSGEIHVEFYPATFITHQRVSANCIFSYYRTETPPAALVLPWLPAPGDNIHSGSNRANLVPWFKFYLTPWGRGGKRVKLQPGPCQRPRHAT